ncbi:hypothetical protein PG994_015009 [Apiospora phragmitis]|uniref:Uncharacterized protein n=1 Tax=Apiospora phragmitis TaxID=2905665 RepID=A0ABR1SVJ7_9PEZI
MRPEYKWHRDDRPHQRPRERSPRTSRTRATWNVPTRHGASSRTWGAPARLPGLAGFTNDQVFFLTFG